MGTNKIYSLTANGLQEIKPIPALPIGMKIFAFGAGMSAQTYCIAEEKNERGYKIVLTSKYYEDSYFSPIQYFDKYDRRISEKFGIGFYWDDKDIFVYPENEVKKYVERAEKLTAEIAEKKEMQKNADLQERENLPAKYPHLKPQPKDYNGKKANLVAELKHRFPKQKFSVKKDGYDTLCISWTDGISLNEVEQVKYLFTDHETDFTGDFRDYAPSNFNRVFGGFNYIFLEREKSEEIQKLSDKLKTVANLQDSYYSNQVLYRMFQKTTIPAGAYNFRIERTEKNGGLLEEFYKIGFDLETETKKDNPVQINSLEIIDYSEKAFAVIGETKPIKDTLKDLGGRFNFRLSCGAGWIFPKSKETTVKMALGL